VKDKPRDRTENLVKKKETTDVEIMKTRRKKFVAGKKGDGETKKKSKKKTFAHDQDRLRKNPKDRGDF